MFELTFASPFNPLVGQKSNIVSLAGYAGLEVKVNSKVSATVRSDSRSICRISGKAIEAVKVGRCVTFISVRTGDTTVIKRLPLVVTKK